MSLSQQIEMRDLMDSARLEFAQKTDRVVEHLETLQASKDRIGKQVPFLRSDSLLGSFYIVFSQIQQLDDSLRLVEELEIKLEETENALRKSADAHQTQASEFRLQFGELKLYDSNRILFVLLAIYFQHRVSFVLRVNSSCFSFLSLWVHAAGFMYFQRV